MVHGHEQCTVCKSNIFECCSGDTCETDHNLALDTKEVNMQPRFSLYRRLMHWLTVVFILGLAVSGMFYSNEI